MTDYKIHLLVCGGTGCKSSNSQILTEHLRTEINKQGLSDFAQVVGTGCFGFCEKGPIVKIIPDNTFYTQVKPEDAKEIVEEHIVKGRNVSKLLYKDPKTEKIVTDSRGMEFYKKQIRIALRNCGVIDPENIEEYIARDGYASLGKVLTSMSPEEAIAVIKKSGLRGRGGAGFPTGLKWEITRQSPGTEKYVVCNADEGDPGAFMDRSILEGDPHTVIEAMAINGYCTGASKGLVYIRAE
jgi:(2Fe-2S) ferredoxin